MILPTGIQLISLQKHLILLNLNKIENENIITRPLQQKSLICFFRFLWLALWINRKKMCKGGFPLVRLATGNGKETGKRKRKK